MLHIDITKKLKTEIGPKDHQYKIEIPPGECLGLVGPSGSGKTSLLKMIAGLLKPEQGIISFNDDLWYHNKNKINLEAQKRDCGLLYQDPVLFPFLTLEENILYGKNDKETAEKYINFLGLEELKKSNITKLSGGQLKRAALAQLLTYNPQTLLLDEPFAFLDRDWMYKLADLLFQIRSQENKTIIIVSHQKEFLTHITDRILTINHGSSLKSTYINNFPCRKKANPTLYFSKPAS